MPRSDTGKGLSRLPQKHAALRTAKPIVSNTPTSHAVTTVSAPPGVGANQWLLRLEAEAAATYRILNDPFYGWSYSAGPSEIRFVAHHGDAAARSSA
jgi:hypothetical protein